MQLRSGILKVIAYFDLFNYPLSLEDILYFLDTEAEEYPVKRELDALIKEGCLFRTGSYYSLQDDSTLADKRNDSRRRADVLLPIAEAGIACVGLRNACHIGRIGAYGEQCADAGLISMHYVNVVGHGPMVAPFAGTSRKWRR